MPDTADVSINLEVYVEVGHINNSVEMGNYVRPPTLCLLSK